MTNGLSQLLIRPGGSQVKLIGRIWAIELDFRTQEYHRNLRYPWISYVIKRKTSLTQSQKNKILVPGHHILGGLVVALILGSIIAFIVIMLYAAWFS